ncbi:protein CIP2A-like [Tachypleus tridentatus]|uniref:protein CIP2A-like n=1 Tax=Tachypleus tridentatus TaxID=6853 RepID=UPI003FD66E14
MDITDYIKTFVHTSHQFFGNKSEQNHLHLQRHLDVLIGLTGSPVELHSLNPHHLSVTECVTALVDILLDQEPKVTLVQKTLSLLQNFVKSPCLKESLSSTFHIHSGVAVFLQNYGVNDKDLVITQCLQLLEVVTYGIKIEYFESCLESLLEFLFKQINSQTTEYLMQCLSILSNLCRNNPLVQAQIKCMSNAKQIYKTLVGKLSSSNRVVVVETLSVLASLVINDDLGEKLFNSNNINRTIQLVINMIVSGDNETRKVAVDLFIDLILSSRLQPYFIRYKYLKETLQQLTDQLAQGKDVDEVAELTRLLATVSSIPGIRPQLLSVVFLEKDSASEEENCHSALLITLQWAKEPADGVKNTSLYAMRFLDNVVREQICEDVEKLCGFRSIVENLIVCITEDLNNSLNFESFLLKYQLEKIIIGVDNLLELCEKTNYKGMIADHMQPCLLQSFIYALFENNSLSSVKNLNCSGLGADVILNIILLMDQLKMLVNGLEEMLHNILQDSRLIQVLAFALTSTSNSSVQKALKIVILGSQLTAFSSLLLGESIAMTNANHSHLQESQTELLASNLHVRNDVHLEHSKSSHRESVKSSNIYNRRCSIDRNIQSLIQKLENGLDIKDLKSSEIMDMYEHKIAGLTLKEQQLQDLVEAKSAALQQSDKLLNQYRCRQAQREAEALRLRKLLKESERRSEDAKELTRQAVQQQRALEHELEVSKQENTLLDQQLEEHKEAIIDHAQRLESVQKSLENLQLDYNSVLEMNAMLQRHSETMKQKQDSMLQQISDLENEKKNLAKQLKEKDTKLKELNRTLQKSEEALQKKEEEYSELENERDTLQKKMQSVEKEKAKLQQEVSSLELLCNQHEAVIQEKTNVIQSLNEQLDRHKNITEMIHNLSSGRINISSLLNQKPNS